MVILLREKNQVFPLRDAGLDGFQDKKWFFG